MMSTRYIKVEMDPSAAELYDGALTGNNDDDDVLLTVEKAIVARLYPSRAVAPHDVNLDVDLVNVVEG